MLTVITLTFIELLSLPAYVIGHEKIGLMCTQNLTTFLNFELQ